VISVPLTRARFIRITQTGTPPGQFQFGWAIQRVRIFAIQ
jgi:hypothetical protein